MPHFTLYPRRQKKQQRVDPPSHLSAAQAHHTPAIIIPAKAREYVFNGVSLSVCVCVCDHDN